MKRLLLLVVLFAPSLIYAQTAGVAYRLRGGLFAARPTVCKATAPVDQYFATDTDIMYVCDVANHWKILASASTGGPGTVTNVTGTSPINVATGTTTPVVSCPTCLVSSGALGTPSSGTLTNATGLPEGGLSLTDITTNNFSTTKHGFVPKGTNVGSFLRDDGTWAAAGASNYYTATLFSGVGPTSFTPNAGTLMVYDATASTGSTSLVIRQGAGQVAGTEIEFRNASGTRLAGIYSSANSVFIANAADSGFGDFSVGNFTANGGYVQSTRASGEAFSMAGANAFFGIDTDSGWIKLGASGDAGYSRCAAGVHCFGTGAQGDSSGTVKAATVNGTTSYQINGVTIYSGGTPTIAGNGTLNAGSKDSAGKITATGTGASTIVLTFSITFTRAPACMITNETTANLVRPISTATGLTVAATIVTGDSLSYVCTGY